MALITSGFGGIFWKLKTQRFIREPLIFDIRRKDCDVQYKNKVLGAPPQYQRVLENITEFLDLKFAKKQKPEKLIFPVEKNRV